MWRLIIGISIHRITQNYSFIKTFLDNTTKKCAPVENRRVQGNILYCYLTFKLSFVHNNTLRPIKSILKRSIP